MLGKNGEAVEAMKKTVAKHADNPAPVTVDTQVNVQAPLQLQQQQDSLQTGTALKDKTAVGDQQKTEKPVEEQKQELTQQIEAKHKAIMDSLRVHFGKVGRMERRNPAFHMLRVFTETCFRRFRDVEKIFDDQNKGITDVTVLLNHMRSYVSYLDAEGRMLKALEPIFKDKNPASIDLVNDAISFVNKMEEEKADTSLQGFEHAALLRKKQLLAVLSRRSHIEAEGQGEFAVKNGRTREDILQTIRDGALDLTYAHTGEKKKAIKDIYDKNYDWENPTRLLVLPKALRYAGDREKRQESEYSEEYNIMDIALLRAQQFQMDLAELEKQDKDKEKESVGTRLAHTMESMLRKLHYPCFYFNEEAEKTAGLKSFDSEKKDGLMVSVAELSFHYGYLNTQMHMLVKRMTPVLESMKDAERERILAQLVGMSEKLATPGVEELVNEYDLSRAHDRILEMIKESSAMLQYFEAMCEEKDDAEQTDMAQSRLDRFAHFRDPERSALEWGGPEVDFEEEKKKIARRRDMQNDEHAHEKREQTGKKTTQDQEESVLKEVKQERSEIEVTATTVSYAGDQYYKDEMYIPKEKIEKLEDFYIDEENKVKGVSKWEARKLRKGKFGGGLLKNSLNRYAQRFLRNASYTDQQAAQVATTLCNYSQIGNMGLSDALSPESAGYEKLKLFLEIKDKTAEEVVDAIQKNKENLKVIGPAPSGEIAYDDPYYRMYPGAAKVLIMSNLLAQLQADAFIFTFGNSKKEQKKAAAYKKDLNDRIEAIKSSLSILKDRVISHYTYKTGKKDEFKDKVALDVPAQAERMSDTSGGLVNLKAKSVSDWSEYLNRHVNLTIQGLYKREKDSDAMRLYQEKMREQRQKREEMHLMTAATLDKRYEAMKEVMRLTSNISESERLMLQIQAPATLPDYKEKVGGAYTDILRNHVESDMLPLIPAELGYDKDKLYELVLKQLRQELFSGDKNTDKLIEGLSTEKFRSYIDSYTARLRNMPDFYKLCVENEKNDKRFMDYEIRRILEGKAYISDAGALGEEYKRFRIKDVVKTDLKEIFAQGEELPKQKIALDVLKFKQATYHSKLHIRAVVRTDRMYGMDSHAARINEMLTKLGIKEPVPTFESYFEKTDVAKAEDESALDPGAIWDGYVTEMNKWSRRISAIIKQESAKAQNDAERSDGLNALNEAVKAFSQFRKDDLTFAGLTEYGQDLIDALGDGLNAEERGDFEPHLCKVMIGLYRREKAAKKALGDKFPYEGSIREQIRSLCLKNDDAALRRLIRGLNKEKTDKTAEDRAVILEAVRKKDKRIKEFAEMSGGAYRPLLRILLEDDEFREHLAGDDEEEYSAYLDGKMGRVKDVVTELYKHMHIEQYLLGLRKQIKEALKDGKNLPALSMALAAHDEKIDSYVIQPGSLLKKEITIGSLIEKALTGKKIPEEHKERIKMQYGNVLIMVMQTDGIDKILDERAMNGYVDRVIANEAALDKEIDTFPFNRMLDKEKLRIVLHHNERQNMVNMDKGDYEKSVYGRLVDWNKRFSEDRKREDEFEKRRKKIVADSRLLIEQKQKGRAVFRNFFVNTFNDARKERKNFDPDTSQPFDLKQRLSGYSENVREMVNDIISKKDMLPADQFLNSFYSSVITRMSMTLNAGSEAMEQELKLQYMFFVNAMMLYNGAVRYCRENGIEGAKRLAVLNGLFDYYGEDLYRADVAFDEDGAYEGISTLFSEEKGGSEAVNFIMNDAGGYYGVGSDTEMMRSGIVQPMQGDVRFGKGAFEEALTKSGERIAAEFKGLSEEEKRMVGHVLLSDGNRRLSCNAIELAIRNETAASASRSDMIFKYLHGDAITEPNYAAMMAAVDLTGGMELLSTAVNMVRQFRPLKQQYEQRKFDVSQAEFEQIMGTAQKESEKEKAGDIRFYVWTLSMAAQKLRDDLKNDTKLTNREKLIRYYYTLKPYGDDLAKFDQKYGKEKDAQDEGWPSKELIGSAAELLGEFNSLKAYVSLYGQRKEILSGTDPEAKKKCRKELIRIEFSFKDRLGLADRDKYERKDGTFSEKHSFRKADAQELMENFLDEMDAQIHRIGEHSRKEKFRWSDDRDGSGYDPEILAAVKEVDRYVARHLNDSAQGDSESMVGAQILSRPVRERLLAYYMVEKKLGEGVTQFDALQALNTYKPNVDLFKEGLEEKWYRQVAGEVISGIRSMSGVRQSSIFRNVLAASGSKKVSRLESALRILDDEDGGIAESLSEMEAAKHKEEDARLPESVRIAHRDRQKKLNNLMKELDLLHKKAEEAEGAILKKEEKQSEVAKQEAVMRDAMALLLDADRKVGRQALDYREELFALYGKDGVEAAEDNAGQTVGDKTTTISGGLASATDAFAEKAAGFWDLSSTSLSKVCTASGMFRGAEAVGLLISAVAHCYDAEYGVHKAGSQKVIEQMNAVECICNASVPMAQLIASVALSGAKSIGEAVVNGANGFTAGAGIAVNVVRAIEYGVQKVEVTDSEEESLRREQELRSRMKDASEEQKKQAALRLRAVRNVGTLQKNTLDLKQQVAMINAAGGAAALAGCVFPPLVAVTGIVGGMLSAVAKLREVLGEKENKTDAVDRYIGVTDLLKKYKESGLAGDQKDEDIKEMLRQKMLARMHFSSFEQFFEHVAVHYAKVLYRHIFFDEDGKQILGNNKRAIRERRPYTGLFPGLQFGWPKEAGYPPYPTMEQMAQNLMKTG